MALMNNKFYFADSHSIKQLQENWGWYLALGISLVVLGTLAVLFSYTTTIFSLIYLGVFLMVIGLFEIIQSCTLNKWSTFFLHLFLGILYMVGGFFMLANPMLNALTLTLMMAFFFMVSGISKTVFAAIRPVPHRGWLILNGITSFILGFLVWKEWPFSGFWFIGMLVGIDTIITGWTLIMLSYSAKTIKK